MDYMYLFLKHTNTLNSCQESKKKYKKNYTTNQFEKAKKAKDLYHSIGTPSIHDFKAIRHMYKISKNSVTSQDINTAERIMDETLVS
jgi:hypothetical protein